MKVTPKDLDPEIIQVIDVVAEILLDQRRRQVTANKAPVEAA
jgi:hypothetical protein